MNLTTYRASWAATMRSMTVKIAPSPRRLWNSIYPALPETTIPATDVGAALALADRLDTLVAIFSIGQRPSGSRDPFALRRASLGILRIIIERNIDLDLKQAISYSRPAVSPYGRS